VQAGDVAKAKSLYAAARAPYERIEPVAESFGDLDPHIDARAGDVPASQWRGFHRIEQALYQNNTTAGMAAVAGQLLTDVKTLQGLVKNVQLEPKQIANGAKELLDEVSSSKITGEEERYSHIDLVDLAANVDGSQTAFNAVAPLIGPAGPSATEISKRFQELDASLAAYRTPTGFVLFNQLTPAQTTAIAQRVNAIAEPLSQVAAHLPA
jgi:iron uptake system component EfeO